MSNADFWQLHEEPARRGFRIRSTWASRMIGMLFCCTYFFPFLVGFLVCIALII